MTWRPPDTVPHRPRPPAVVLVAAFTAAGLILTGIGLPGPCLWVGVVAAAGALVAWLASTSVVPLTLHADRVEETRSGRSVGYAELRFLRVSGRALVDAASTAGARHLLIGHEEGVWRVPRTTGLDRLALYGWLLERSALLRAPDALPGRPGRNALYDWLLERGALLRANDALPGRLDEVRAREAADFGAERVLASTGRATCRGDPPTVRWVLCLAVAIALTGVVGRTLGAPAGYMLGMNWGAGSMALIALLVAWARSHLRVRLEELRNASGVVVSPRSLTLESRALKGELLWAEVRGLVVVNSASPLTTGLKFRLDGATFLLADHYTCPLTEIERVVRRHLAHG